MVVFVYFDDEIGCIGIFVKYVWCGDEVLLVWIMFGEFVSQFGDIEYEEVWCIWCEYGVWVVDKIGVKYYFFDMGDSCMIGGWDEVL